MKQNLSEFWSGEEYDAQYGHLYESEIAFLTNLAQQTPGNGFLDLCCGTGIVTIPLSKRFKRTIGLDIAEPMLAHARRKSMGKGNVDFLNLDATQFDLSQSFDLVAMTGNAFQAFLLDSDLESLLSNIRKHLSENGLFAFDTRLNGLTHFETSEDFQYWQSYQSSDQTTVKVYGKCSQHESIDNTVIYHTKRVFEDERSYQSSIELKYRSLEEIERYLTAAGLEIMALYADWDESPFSQLSKRLICVAKAS